MRKPLLMDMSGRLLINMNPAKPGNSYQVELTGPKEGTYILMIKTTGNHEFPYRFVKN